jgi:hypothetical protein
MKIKFPVTADMDADILDAEGCIIASASWHPGIRLTKRAVATAAELVRILNAAHEAGLTAKKWGKK